MRIAFKTLLTIASIMLAYMCYRSIMDPIEFEQAKAERDKKMVKRNNMCILRFIKSLYLCKRFCIFRHFL